MSETLADIRGRFRLAGCRRQAEDQAGMPRPPRLMPRGSPGELGERVIPAAVLENSPDAGKALGYVVNLAASAAAACDGTGTSRRGD
jgi:hypothetical protein